MLLVVYYLAGFIENWGRGYEKIRNAFAKENLEVPTFEQVRGGVMATIQREVFVALNKQSGGDVSEIDGINEPLNGEVNNIQLTENQKKVYNYLKIKAQDGEPLNGTLNEPLNTTRIANELNMAYSTVKRIMKFLEQKGLILRIGSKKTGYWQVKS